MTTSQSRDERSVKVTIYLVRHAKAGDRASWPGDDFLRPLSRRGQIQAEALLDAVRRRSTSIGCCRARTSAAWRRSCRSRGVRRIPIEPVDALTEGAALEDALTLVRKHAHHDAVLCSHGDIIPMLLEHYAARGVDLGKDPVCPKGCTWILEIDATGDVRRALPPRRP